MFKNIAVLAFCFALLSAITIPAVANSFDQKTVVTFNQAIEINGVVLPPGTYVMKLFPSDWTRNIVQVFDEKETHLFATIISVPSSRFSSTGKTLMTTEERKASAPAAIRTWFYPGEVDGHEFVNPKAKPAEAQAD